MKGGLSVYIVFSDKTVTTVRSLGLVAYPVHAALLKLIF